MVKRIFTFFLALLMTSSSLARTQLAFSKNEEFLNKLSKAFIAELYSSGRLIGDPLSSEYLQSIADKLVENAKDKHHRYRFFLINAPDINAFAAPGGSIVVNSGLFLAANHQDEVAAVLAHEIMHVKQDHLLQTLDHMQQSTIPMIASGLLALAVGLLNPALGGGMLMMGSAGLAQSQINFTRSNEADSDHLGMALLYKAGFNPECMASFFQRLQQQSRLYDMDNVPALLRSHPLTTFRIAEANDRAETFPKKSYPLDPMFPYLKERIRVETVSNPQELLAQYQREIALGAANTPVLQYGYGLAASKALQFEKAQKILTALHEEHPENDFISIGLVDSYLDANQIKPGLALAKSLLEAHPKSRLYRYYNANAYIYGGEPQIALQLIDDLIQQDPENSQYWLLKVSAHRTAKQQAEAYYALGQALYLESMDRAALKHFKHALVHSKKHSSLHELAHEKVRLLSRKA